MKNIWILAADEGDMLDNAPVTDIQETEGTTQVPGGTTEGTPPVEPKKKGFEPIQLVFFGLMFVLIYMMMFRGPKKKQQKHKNMVQALQKNDRVKTIGGIIGTIIDVKDDIITLKIDESNNTKIKVIAGAISGKISDE